MSLDTYWLLAPLGLAGARHCCHGGVLVVDRAVAPLGRMKLSNEVSRPRRVVTVTTADRWAMTPCCG
jgi:hypothetical protein